MADLKKPRLTETVRSSGCAAKIGPSDLTKALCGLEMMRDENVLVGLETGDDAGVYRLSDDLAIIQTIDFVTPIVDDPYTYGQIAAANSISDVYAMGGTPITAMNVVCFPINSQDVSMLSEILRGGLDKMREAGVALIGGHSVADEEMKYGLSVTGVIHPSQILRRNSPRIGDKLILTKPIGTGIVSTAIKGGVADTKAIEPAVRSMTTLNKKAAELMRTADVHACTDVTGFSLMGHSYGMIKDSKLGMEINASAIPVLDAAREFASMGLVPGGARRNMDYYRSHVEQACEISDEMRDILFDPQTSGGLLIAVSSDTADELIKKMHRSKITDAAVIGRITDEPKGKIVIRE
jgi:selenide,water dikinase